MFKVKFISILFSSLFLMFLSVFTFTAFAQTCVDSDGDGYGLNGDASCINAGVDCNDTNNTMYPNAPLKCDGLDNNCDGNKDFMTDEDKDGDGEPWCAGDCDDNNPNRSHYILEGPYGDAKCSDGIDNDCDNRTDAIDRQCKNICTDIDGDGYGNPGHGSCTNGSATDCNDNNASINPGVTDSNCNGVDDNCTGTADEGYVVIPTNCGVGECASIGQWECQSGVEANTCTPGTPVLESPIGSPECGDGLDNDCDGTTDTGDTGCAACTDNDGDGYGSNGDMTCLNGPIVDCNDNDVNINPGASDANCDTVDDNCSGTADDGYVVTPTNCGVGGCTSSGQMECQAGVETDTCLPLPAGTEGPYPGSTCNDAIDNDCDGFTDGADIADCSSLDVDDDGDSFTENQGDCDDTNSAVYPNAPLKCDGLDNNCDGNKDFMTDEDKDLDGVPWCGGDCDDNDSARYPGNIEVFGHPSCSDGIDNDCDNRIDIIDPQCADSCTDDDGDGYGNPGHGSCANGSATDCNDSDININPGATDSNCDEVDDNCTGTADDGYIGAPTNCGVGSCASSGQFECQSGVEVDICTPGDPGVEYPIGNLVCGDGADNDCDGLTDGADPGCAACTDNDGDGYGSNGDVTCLNGTAIDCNDNDININPGASDANCNGVDNNCTGTADDGYVVTLTNCGVGGCANSGQLVCQSGTEVDTCVAGTPQTEGPYPGPTCSDLIDNDCDGLTDGADIADCSSLNVDDDGDGFTENQGDCDDTNNTVYPGAPLFCDGLDNNCDGNKDFLTDEDKDLDGVPWCGGDCDDNDPTRYPGNQEGPRDDVTCSDGIDNDCDNNIDILDTECAPPSCNTIFAPQDGPHIFDLLDPVDDSVIASPCSWCHTDALLGSGTTEQRILCERCHADPAWGGANDGIIKTTYFLDPPYGFGTATNVRLHSSTTLGTKYGSWNLQCLNCHNPHLEEQDALFGTNYGQLIREYICFDNPVTGLNIEEIIEFTNDSGVGSFADGPPHNENICDMCHTQTDHHRRDGMAPGDLDAGNNYIGHNDEKKCTKCHSHFSGFSPAGADLNRPHNTQFFFDNCQFCHLGEATDALDFAQKVPAEKCQQCHGERHEHTSDPIRNPYASGKYSYDITCVDCHDPMFSVDGNRMLLRPLNAFSIIPGSIIVNTTRIGPGSLADGEPYNENICETCHSLTDHHQYDGTALGGQNHNDGEYCMLCHDHNRSFMISGPSAEE